MTQLAKECATSRTWLQERYANEYSMALRFHSEKPFSIGIKSEEEIEVDKICLSHIRECELCVEWVQTKVSAKVFQRQKRLAAYCCTRLFSAVEEPKNNQLGITLQYWSPVNYEGAHSWKLSLKAGVGKSRDLLVNFCPFCGGEISVYKQPPNE